MSAREEVVNELQPTLSAGLVALCQAKPAEPLRWLGDWLRDHNPNATA